MQETWEDASFNVKKTCPAGAAWRLLTSPRTRTRPRRGFDRTVSRISFASCETVRDCGTPGRASHGTAMRSIVSRGAIGSMNPFRGEIAESVFDRTAGCAPLPITPRRVRSREGARGAARRSRRGGCGLPPLGRRRTRTLRSPRRGLGDVPSRCAGSRPW